MGRNSNSRSGKGNKSSKNNQNRSKRRQKGGHSLPPVLVAEMTGLNDQGEALAVPAKWEDERRRPPVILLTSGPGAAEGDSVLVKIEPVKGQSHDYTGTVLKILPNRVTRTVVGLYQHTKRGGLIEPVNRKQKQSFYVASQDDAGAESGDVVTAEVIPRSRNKQLGLPCAKVTERLGDMQSPKCYSLIAIFNQDIPVDFSPEAIAEAEAAEAPVPTKKREDLREIPLITIDGEDARDFDDAVFAEKDGEGWHLLVAIADVAHYVTPGSALDKEALERGNSTYFPDRVVPMLPEALSNGLCSLNPKVDRYCLAVHLWINAEGELQRHQFVRGIMRSHARLTYEQAQAMYENLSHRERSKDAQQLSGEGAAEATSNSEDAESSARPHPKSKISTSPVGRGVLENLYGAYQALLTHRDERGAMELDLPEFQIQLGEDGHVAEVTKRQRLDSHKLIEEFMVTANIAAGLTLEKKKLPGVYRVHEPPSADKIEELRVFLKSMGHSLSATPSIKDFNKLLGKSRGTPAEALISGAILRSQMQACYLPSHSGHFGLGLSHYSHFTSPIRRYSDLITHRAIIDAIPGQPEEELPAAEALAAQADHISQTERRSMLAEREATDRYITAFMAESGEVEFEGVITSVGNFGVFVTLAETGASGLLRISDLGKEYYIYEETLHCLIGRDSGQRFQLGQRLVVTLKTADMQLGSLSFLLVEAGPPPEMALPPASGKPRRKGSNDKNSKKGKGKPQTPKRRRRGKKK